MAPSKAIFDHIVEKFEEYMELHTSVRIYTEVSSPDPAGEEEEECDDADEHVDLIEFPSEGSSLEIALWIALFPLRFLMHFTVPDVRQLDRNGNPTVTIGYAYLATFMCLVWLVMGSYAMVASLEALAELMDIPDTVIGVTVSAAGRLDSP
jgi:Ca2+/Na+ antiporter